MLHPFDRRREIFCFHVGNDLKTGELVKCVDLGASRIENSSNVLYTFVVIT